MLYKLLKSLYHQLINNYKRERNTEEEYRIERLKF